MSNIDQIEIGAQKSKMPIEVIMRDEETKTIKYKDH